MEGFEVKKEDQGFTPDIEFLHDRTKHIGSSDIAPILGLSPYSTPREVYYKKTDPSKLPDLSEQQKQRMQVGLMAEGIVLDLALESIAKERGCSSADLFVVRDERFTNGNCTAQVDAVLDSEILLEAKTVGEDAFRSWKHYGSTCETLGYKLEPVFSWCSQYTLPVYYHLQVMFALAVSGYEKAILSALSGNFRLANFTIKRQELLCGALLQFAEMWWEQHVVAGKVPPPSSKEELNGELASVATNEMVEVDDKMNEMLVRYIGIKEQLDFAMKEKAKMEAIIKNSMIGLKAKSLAFGGKKVAWVSHYNRNSVDMEKLEREHKDIFDALIRPIPITSLRVKGI